MNREIESTFVPVSRAAHDLGVPRAWLLREARAGRVPAVQAGRRWLVHMERARKALTSLAEAREATDA